MINAISSMNYAMSMMQSRPMERQPPPPDQDVFQMTDTDCDGMVSESELTILTEAIEETTGTVINLEDALSNFDEDQDGALTGEELKGLMDSSGFSPFAMPPNDNGEAMRMPPPPPSSEQAVSAYAQNSGQDQLEQLIQILQDQTGDTGEFYSIDVTG